MVALVDNGTAFVGVVHLMFTYRNTEAPKLVDQQVGHILDMHMLEWDITVVERNDILERTIRGLARKLAPPPKISQDDLGDTEQDLRDMWSDLKDFAGANPL